MANVIAPYDTMWYAHKFIERLEAKLTFVPTLSRDFDEKARDHGSTIEFKKPGGFTAQTFPIAAGSASDVNPTKDTITLDQWKGVQFGLTDLELAYSGDEIIKHHIDPAMQAVAEAMESSAVGLITDVGNYVDVDGTTNIKDFVNVRNALNKANVSASDRFLGINFQQEAIYLSDNLFLQANTGSEGTQTQREGYLGRKMGLDTSTIQFLGNTNPGTLVGTPVANAAAIGTNSITLTAGTLTGTLKKGDILTFAGVTRKYAVSTALATAAGNSITVTLARKLEDTIAGGTAVTVRQASKGLNIGYQKSAFALVMAPLSDAGNGRGAEIGVAIDDQTGTAIRVTRWYDPQAKKHWLSFDALWGVKTTDADRAVRLEGNVVT